MLLCVGRIDSAVYQYDDDNALVSSKQVLLIFPLTTDNKQTKYKYKESLVCLLIWFLEWLWSMQKCKVLNLWLFGFISHSGWSRGIWFVFVFVWNSPAYVLGLYLFLYEIPTPPFQLGWAMTWGGAEALFVQLGIARPLCTVLLCTSKYKQLQTNTSNYKKKHKQICACDYKEIQICFLQTQSFAIVHCIISW